MLNCFVGGEVDDFYDVGISQSGEVVTLSGGQEVERHIYGRRSEKWKKDDLVTAELECHLSGINFRMYLNSELKHDIKLTSDPKIRCYPFILSGGRTSLTVGDALKKFDAGVSEIRLLDLSDH